METKVHTQQDHKISERLEDVVVGTVDCVREGDYLEMIRKLRLELADKSSECELLKIKLNVSDKDVDKLNLELNKCKLALFENNEDFKKNNEEVSKSKKLEEDYVKLMSDFIALGEQTDQYKQKLNDDHLANSNAINNYENMLSNGVIANELEVCKSELDTKIAELNVVLTKLKFYEEDVGSKDRSIKELKKALDDTKLANKHEITVLEEHIECLKNTITSYERTLASLTNIEPKPNEF